MTDLNSQLGGDILNDSDREVFEIIDLGNTLQDGVGCTPDDVDSSEVFNLMLVVDDSSSIRDAGNEQSILDFTNRVLAALRKSQSRDDIIATVVTLNRGVVRPAESITTIADLTTKEYQATGGTPLYDAAITACAFGMMKRDEFIAQGSDFRGLIVLLSDGEDCGSRTTADQSKQVVEKLLANEVFCFIAVGVSNGHTDFEQIFTNMGIPKEWILTVNDDEKSIRDACGVVSRASAHASMAGGLSQSSGINEFAN